MLVPMVLILMLELMVPTTLARGLLMLSLRPRLMLLFSMELTDMLDMLLPLPMDMLHILDTPMLLVMLVPMEHMVPTTLARGLLMLSLKLRLMLSMVPMDILHILLPMLMDTLDMPDMLDTLMPPMVLMLITDKKKLSISNLHQEKSIYFPSQHQDKNGNEFQLEDLTHSQ